MKKAYIFLLALLTVSQIFAQDFCSDADSNLIYAYSNVKDAYESNNLDHLKYYSEKSLKSFEKAKVNLKQCGCESAYNLAYKGAELLSKVAHAETFEDGRFFVKRAKEIGQQTITALNEFTAEAGAGKADELNALQIEKERLEQQRLELKRKEEAIAKKLEEQKVKASNLEKEKLIKKYEEALSLNIETYNELLRRYGSSSELSVSNKSKDELLSEEPEDIKAYFIDNIKKVTNSYLAELNNI
ncbi:hypothetical protein [Seonamhaeicola sp.]|uniref:hypothetical protein n=1 Tax=Seonamhaeicola sp. TaxID=1912245 RepID=UPI0026281C81|nr:hypothetical protein [Seonamhaeicola sp.]